MSWPGIFDGPVATELQGGWTGRLQLNAVNYDQSATAAADPFKDQPTAFGSSDVSGVRGDRPAYAGTVVDQIETKLTDYRFRFWVVPTEQRLVNPALNTDLPYILWNTWPENQTVQSVTISDATILDPDLEVPDVILANQYFSTTYQIIDSPGGDIEEFFTFVFDDETITINVFGSLASTFNIVPDVPVKETWEFLTDIIQVHNGDEQRIALRKRPRTTLDFTVDILDFSDRREQYITTFRNMGLSAIVPLYQHATSITQDAAPGATKVFFDPSKTQMQEGQPIIIIDPRNDGFQIATVSTMDADGANITSTFADPISTRQFVFPGIALLLKDGAGIATYKVTGKMKINGEDIGPVELIRSGNSATLTYLDGLPVMEQRIVAGSLIENFARRKEVLDNETGVEQVFRYTDPHAYVEGIKKFEINRYDGVSEDYMRLFINTVRGAQKAFLLPTWMPDMILAETPAEGGGSISVEGTNYPDFFASFPTWSYIMIQYADERQPTYHIVSDAAIGDDSNTDFTISPALTLGDANTQISRISFLNRVRGEDRITRTHYEQLTEYSWGIRTVDV